MKRIRAIRQERGMSLRRMAALAGVDPGTASRIETGRLIPYDRDLTRLCGAIGWLGDPAALLEEVGDASD